MSIYAVILFCLLSALTSPATAEEIGSGREIIRRMDTLMRGDTSAGIYEMTVRDPNWERTLRLKVWEKRKEKKTFIRILSPSKEEGIGTLKIGFEMWNYLPKVEKTIKVPPSTMMTWSRKRGLWRIMSTGSSVRSNWMVLMPIKSRRCRSPMPLWSGIRYST